MGLRKRGLTPFEKGVDNMLEIKTLTKKYGDKVAVDNLSLHIMPGEIYGFIGHNGAGKTTTIKACTGILKFEEGDILIDGVSIKENPLECKRNIAYIPDNPDLYDFMTGMGYLNFIADIFAVPEEVRNDLIDKYADAFEIKDNLGQLISEYSHGMKQKLAIISAWIHEPKLIIMDEPTVAVDPQSRNKILEGIQKLNEQGSTIIYTSHYMEEVEQICTRIAIMDHGRVIAQGTKEELKQMIKTGETITVEAIALEEKNLQDIRTLDHVFDVQYEKQVLVVRCTDARHNLIRLLNYLQSQDISFGRVFSELPTLNDVFLEITGKQLRD